MIRFNRFLSVLLVLMASCPLMAEEGFNLGYEYSGECENKNNTCEPCTEESPGTCSDTGSLISGVSGEHIHDALDYSTDPNLPSGCAPCGSGGSDSRPSNTRLQGLSIQRFRQSRDTYTRGAFGQSWFGWWDVLLKISPSSYKGATVGDVQVKFPTEAHAQISCFEVNTALGDTQIDGVYRPDIALFASVTLRDATFAVTPVQSAARFAVIEKTHGERWVMELITLADGRYGRLVRREDANGNATVLTYRFPANATLEQMGGDRNRLFMIETIRDAMGNQATLTWTNTPDANTRYCITAIALPNQTQITYQYSSGRLSGVSYPNGDQAVFTHGYDAVRQMTTIEYVDPGASGTHRRKKVWYSAAVYTRPDGTTHGQAYGLTTRLEKGGEVFYARWFGNVPGMSRGYFYLGGNAVERLTTYGNMPSVAESIRGFTFDPTRTTAPDFQGTTLELKSKKQGDRSNNLPNSKIRPDGRRQRSDYDVAKRAWTTRVFDDGFTETRTLSPLARPLVETDELGRRTEHIYDSRGNLKEKTVAVGTSDQATWKWSYSVDRGLLTSETDANGNITDYSYYPNGQLQRITQPADQLGGVRPWTLFTYDTAGRLATVTLSRENGGQMSTGLVYDTRGRLWKKTYADGSYEEYLYGSGVDANLLVRQYDRNRHYIDIAYDAAGRETSRTEGLAVGNTSAARTVQTTYLQGTELVATRRTAGELEVITYNDRNEEIARTVHPRSGSALTSTRTLDVYGRAWQMTDAFNRRTFTAYDARDRVVRTVRELLPGVLSIPAGSTAPVVWSGADIGTVGLAGTQTISGSTITISGSGATIWSTADSFRYASQPCTSDGVITARLTALNNPNSGAKMGLMFRDGTDPDAAHALLAVTPQSGIVFLYRTETGDGTLSKTITTATVTPQWLRLTRQGSLVTAATSLDGLAWTDAASATVSFTLNARVGVFALSQNQTSLAQATFNNVAITRSGTPAPGSYEFNAQAWLKALPRDANANPGYVIEDMDYDAAGQMTARTDARGLRTAYTYDVQGRLTTVTEAAGTVTQARTAYQYDAQGNRTQVTSPGLDVSKTTYTKRNLPATMIEAFGTSEQVTVRTVTYSPTRKPLSETDALGRTTRYAYGLCCDRLQSITDPSGAITSFDYDFVGNRTSVTDPNLLTIVTGYDARNRVTSVTNAAGEQTQYLYDEVLSNGVQGPASPALTKVQTLVGTLGLGSAVAGDGAAVFVRAPGKTNGAADDEITAEVRDGLGRTVARVDALAHTTLMAYDTVVAGLVETTQTDALGHVNRARADGAGRVRQQVDALGHASTATFDANGNQLGQRDALGLGWNALYDGRNRILVRTTTRANAMSEEFAYDLDSNQISTIRRSPDNQVISSEVSGYDVRNRRTTLTDRLGGRTRFGYDAVGNLISISDADNEAGTPLVAKTTQYAYNSRNLLIAEAFPTGQQGRTLRVYGYDGARRLTSRRVGILAGSFSATPTFAGASTTTTYGYDNANRLATRAYPDGANDSFGYDATGRLTNAVSARYANMTSRAYDAAGRLTSESLSIDGQSYPVGYAYLDDNTLGGLTYPQTGSVVQRTYTDRHELKGVTLGGATVNSRLYDAAGRLSSHKWGGLAALNETRTYVPGDHRVSSITVPSVTSFAYTYDAVGRKMSESGQAFAYDAADRLVSWVAGSETQSWNLTKVGDWGSTTRNGVVESRANTAVHEVSSLTVGGSTTALAYDMQGNLTRDEQGRLLAWDPENRLNSAGVADGASYRYDALGRRVAKTVGARTTYYLPAGAQTVVELDRAAVRSQAVQTGATADGELAHLALAPAGGSLLTPASGAGAVTRVNFQPSGAVIPQGFLADTGKTLATRTNGFRYGWSADRRASGVQHPNAVPRPAWTTAIRMQGASWSIALPPGRYAVAVVAGDALDTNLTNNLVIGTMPVTDGSPATEPVYEVGNFDGYLQVVTVGVAGAVTIAPGVGALNPTLCVTEIVAIPAGLANEAGWLAAQQASLAAAVDAMNTATMAPGTSDDVIREFVYGSYVDEVIVYRQTVGGVTKRYFPHYNHLYSVAALTGEPVNGVVPVVERYTYDAYGKQTITAPVGGVVRAKSAVGFDRGFTGYVADNETGLLHARARQYSPTLGRFIGRDPVGYVDGFSLYGAYFIPGKVDPTGEMSVEACNKAVSAAKETPKTKAIIEDLTKRNCPQPTISCECCNTGQGGSYNRGNVIKICTDVATESTVGDIVHHEFIHAWDKCRGEDIFDDCDARVCSEIRAYSNSGLGLHRDIVTKASFKNYVKTGVKASAEKQCPDWEKRFEALFDNCSTNNLPAPSP